LNTFFFNSDYILFYFILFYLNKYALDRLKAHCEESLSNNLDIENAIDTLILADLHSASQLKSSTIEFINAHANEIMETSAWKNMVSRNPNLIAEIFKAYVNQQIPSFSPIRKRLKAI
jgi:speckle-type POZ protein